MEQKEFRVFGPPGCGKTTYLARQIENACRVDLPQNVFVTSFTRAAAEELAGRGLSIPKKNIGTLHSHCFNALNQPHIAETADGYKSWTNFCEQNNLRQFLLYRTGAEAADADTNAKTWVDSIGTTRPGNELLRDLQRLRGAMIHREMWPADVVSFERAWSTWKSDAGFMDFTDLVEYGGRFDHAPGKPSIGFVDEAQDLSALEMRTILRWTSSMERVITALDDEQCQPAGNMILTRDGEVPIEQLDPEKHWLVGYKIGRGGFVGTSKKLSYTVERHEHHGKILRIEPEGGRASTYTDNHLCTVRWTKERQSFYCVYLMRRGGYFRMGWCQMFRSDDVAHFTTRAHLEDADDLWIVDTYESKDEASVMESAIASKYGIPLVMFLERKNATLYSQGGLERIFDFVGADALKRRAARMLRAFGRDIAYPLIERSKVNKFGRTVFEVRACNVLPGIMEVPTVTDSMRGAWGWAKVNAVTLASQTPVTVWGINVEDAHTYITNGVVTHNCLYTFKGARPDLILSRELPPENVRVLSQSYRVPQHVHSLAVAWAENRIHVRYPKEYRPKLGDPGRVIIANRQDLNSCEGLLTRIDERTSQGQTCMILATCRHMLAPMVKYMREQGIRFHNPYTPSREWNPAEDVEDSVGAFTRLAAFLAPLAVEGGHSRCWTLRDVQLWVKDLTAKSAGLRRGLQRKMATTPAELLPEGEVVVREMFDPVLPEAARAVETLSVYGPGELDERGRPDLIRWLDWYEEHLSNRANAMRYAVNVVRRTGAIPQHMGKPKIIIGTIHSVKGGEADCVFLAPDISPIGAASMARSQEAMDAMGRAFYVGMTRAKQELFLMSHVKGNPKADFRPLLDMCGAPYFIEGR